MPVVHEFDPPERFVAGTVGPPGSRTFYLQARSGHRLVSVTVEKQQVEVLADRMGEVLEQVDPAASGNGDNEPLESPIDAEFRVGTMTLSWDQDAERVVIELFRFEEPEAEELMLVRLPTGQARGFIERAQRVVSAGRPDCPFCGGPVDPDGHLCVRANGFRRRQ